MEHDMTIKLQKVARTRGHLSAKLAVLNEDGSTTWFDYDTRGQTVEPTGTIMVFSSLTGQYEAARDLAHAKQLFAEHTARLTVLTPLAERVAPVSGSTDTTNANHSTRVIIL
jgi:hypothetical protein